MFRNRWSGGLWKPKNPHSLEYLKYLYGVLSKNATVTEQNRSLLVEALRAISEILIWGDQNDGSVFDFFLEKNMLSFFLRIMKQKCGRYVCTQLLQTLNILFENIRNETSLYYLLSNNHVNSIITHRFDFSDEEILAYYISFLKTLSLKLNNHSVHFFFNEHTNDFPLYTEAIKFFNHSESMVRIAVRTLTLNVFRVNEPSMLDFIRNKTAAPYFSNLVWFIGNHIVEINQCAQSDPGPSVLSKLSSFVGEHLDHIHYVNDILCLNIASLNEVLIDQLLRRLFLPLYLGSLAPHLQPDVPHVTLVVALFLISQLFFVITHPQLVGRLAELLLTGDAKVFVDFSASPEKTQESRTSAMLINNYNCTDEEKIYRLEAGRQNSSSDLYPLIGKPFLCSLLNALDCSVTDHAAFYGYCLLYGIGHNNGVNDSLLADMGIMLRKSEMQSLYNQELVQRLVKTISASVHAESPVRIVTFELCFRVLEELLTRNSGDAALDQQLAVLYTCREKVVQLLRHHFTTEDLFLDLFEDEYRQFSEQNFNFGFLSSNAVLLLPPLSTPLSGVEFSKRLPCGAHEHARRNIRVFFLLRQLLLRLCGESETKLPLTNPEDCVRVDDCLNLNNSDLLSCTVVQNEKSHSRFLVTDGLQLILVEPDNKRVGWGVVKLVGFLQDLEVSGDKEDNRALHVTIHQRSSKAFMSSNALLNAKFVYDDHIRCMAAKQRLTKGRQKARQYKMDLIAQLLDIPEAGRATPTPPVSVKHLTTRPPRDKPVPGYVTVTTSSAGSSYLNNASPPSSGSTLNDSPRNTVESSPRPRRTSGNKKDQRSRQPKRVDSVFKRRVRVLSIGSMNRTADTDIPMTDMNESSNVAEGLSTHDHKTDVVMSDDDNDRRISVIMGSRLDQRPVIPRSVSLSPTVFRKRLPSVSRVDSRASISSHRSTASRPDSAESSPSHMKRGVKGVPKSTTFTHGFRKASVEPAAGDYGDSNFGQRPAGIGIDEIGLEVREDLSSPEMPRPGLQCFVPRQKWRKPHVQDL